MSFSTKTKILLKEQLKEWELAGNNYKGLEKVKTKAIRLDGGATIKVQFNPERITSSAAKVDAKSIQQRPCFLCEKNRPKEQRGLPFNNNYTVLVNPFPIFPEHLTIPHKEHIDQLIENHFDSMLDLAKELEDFTVFYNGPKCGASAPDHFHFQAGIKGFMPIEEEYREGKFTELLGERKGVQLLTWRNYGRHIITLDSISNLGIKDVFLQLLHLLKELQPNDSEPMFNILAYTESGRTIVHIFPRALHRPDYFFAEGDNQILISPASVDMGGVFITPREVDFEKITSNDISSILKQVSMKGKATKKIMENVLKKFLCNID